MQAEDHAQRDMRGQLTLQAQQAQDNQHAAELQRRYLIRFEEDTLRSPSRHWIRVMALELAGTFLLVTVAARAG